MARNTQHTDLGFGLLATNYSGDLAEPHLEFAQTRIGAQVFIRRQLNPFFLLRGQVFAGILAGDDRHGSTHAGRNFKFSTQVLECSGLLELALGTYQYDPLFSANSLYLMPYLFGGVGAGFIKSKVEYYGPAARKDEFVRSPIPEGGKDHTSLLLTPVGLGLRVIVRQQFTLGLEACARPAYSDLLDGTSLNGNPSEGDWFYTLGVQASYFLNGPWQHRRGMF